MTLDTPVRYLPKIGPTMASRLSTLGISSVADLLYYAPFRYNDYSHVSLIRNVHPGDTVTITGTVINFRNIFTKTGKRMQEATIQDGTGTIAIIWFNQMYLSGVVTVGSTIHASGKVDFFVRKLALFSPDYEVTQSDAPSIHTGRIVPVYSETQGVSSKWLRGRIAQLLPHVPGFVEEQLPDDVIARHRLVGLIRAITDIHFPRTIADATEAKRRLSFDEFLRLQLTAHLLKQEWENSVKAKTLSIGKKQKNQFMAALPFELTADQQDANTAIEADLSKTIPMNRLLEGDVGSGKTVVAAFAAFVAFCNKRQTLLMAPTQLLAQQHFNTLQSILSPLGVTVSLVTGGQSKKIIERTTDVYVGTHALLSEKRAYARVGLIVIDEQHRFGVKQRELIRTKSVGRGKTPHILTMTATPIPRTIALTIYGNLALTTLSHSPKGRKVVKTWVVPPEKRTAAYAWIKKQLTETKTQAFIVCPLIEDSESLETVKAVKSEYERLKTKIFPSLRLALLHGRLKPSEKNDILEAFRGGDYDILVATPVVEVGIDIPNASVMLIEDADRFGLSQLHQLRGRVGRGLAQSYCLLFSGKEDQGVIDRLKHLEYLNSGPELAEVDLAIRGPGDLFGTRQHGLPVLRFAQFSNKALIEETQKAANVLISRDPTLNSFPLLRESLKKSTIEGTQD